MDNTMYKSDYESDRKDAEVKRPLTNREKFQLGLEEGDGEKMAAALGNTFNTFGKPDMDGFSKEEQKAVTECGYLTLFMLADRHERMLADCKKGGRLYYDERNKASQLFAANNKQVLIEQYEELTGLPAFPECPEIVKTSHDYGLAWRMGLRPNRMKYVEAGCGWMPGFVRKMMDEHPTLQQSFVRWFVFENLLKEYSEKIFVGNSLSGSIGFPYI